MERGRGDAGDPKYGWVHAGGGVVAGRPPGRDSRIRAADPVLGDVADDNGGRAERQRARLNLARAHRPRRRIRRASDVLRRPSRRTHGDARAARCCARRGGARARRNIPDRRARRLDRSCICHGRVVLLGDAGAVSPGRVCLTQTGVTMRVAARLAVARMPRRGVETKPGVPATLPEASRTPCQKPITTRGTNGCSAPDRDPMDRADEARAEKKRIARVTPGVTHPRVTRPRNPRDECRRRRHSARRIHRAAAVHADMTFAALHASAALVPNESFHASASRAPVANTSRLPWAAAARPPRARARTALSISPATRRDIATEYASRSAFETSRVVPKRERRSLRSRFFPSFGPTWR